MNRISLSLALVAACVALPAPAQAQWRVAPFLGVEFDVSEEYLLFGVEGRKTPASFPFVLNPRLSYHPFDGGSLLQIDLNLLMPLTNPRSTKWNPFMGAGLAISRDKFEDFSETKPGVNLIAGSSFTLSSSTAQPYFHGQYTATPDFFNVFTVTFGVLFALPSNK